jgi:hypothetical protein
MERQMHKIIETNGQFQVVYALNGGETVVRILNTFSNRADAQRLISDLSGWRF